jgi:hypothetical protein
MRGDGEHDLEEPPGDGAAKMLPGRMTGFLGVINRVLGVSFR